MTRMQIEAVAGGFGGGLAPFLLNLAHTLTEASPTDGVTVTPSVGYFIGLVIFGVIGSFVAYAFKETDLKKAFFLGISAPAMISLSPHLTEPSPL